MLKTIPAISLYVCDFCKKEGKEEDRRLSAKLTLEKREFCYMGNSQGMYDKDYDLCDNCVDEFINFIKKKQCK